MSRDPLTKRAWQYAGTPVDGVSGTYAGNDWLEKGDLLLDTTNGMLYQNTNTQASPTWTEVPRGVASIDKAHLASEVYTIEHFTYIGLSTNIKSKTLTIGKMWSAGTVVRVVYDTSAAIGTNEGIDILDGGTDGAGTDVIDACSDDLNGLDANDLTTPYALSADDYINLKCDGLTDGIVVAVDVQVKVPLGAAT